MNTQNSPGSHHLLEKLRTLRLMVQHEEPYVRQYFNEPFQASIPLVKGLGSTHSFEVAGGAFQFYIQVSGTEGPTGFDCSLQRTGDTGKRTLWVGSHYVTELPPPKSFMQALALQRLPYYSPVRKAWGSFDHEDLTCEVSLNLKEEVLVVEASCYRKRVFERVNFHPKNIACGDVRGGTHEIERNLSYPMSKAVALRSTMFEQDGQLIYLKELALEGYLLSSCNEDPQKVFLAGRFRKEQPRFVPVFEIALGAETCYFITGVRGYQIVATPE
jgi:hypothetical protein